MILPGLIPIIADTEAQAHEREEAQTAKLDLGKALVHLGRPFNYHDFSQYPLDEPFPSVEHLTLNSHKGHAERIIRTAQRENLTLRQAAWRFAAARRPFVGTATQVADEIEHWFTGGACDGFNLRVGNPDDFSRFTTGVLPLLRARGLFRTEYEHTTLRGHLGLPFPVNRHAGAQLAAE